jgi:hypothetical protein
MVVAGLYYPRNCVRYDHGTREKGLNEFVKGSDCMQRTMFWCLTGRLLGISYLKLWNVVFIIRVAWDYGRH